MLRTKPDHINLQPSVIRLDLERFAHGGRQARNAEGQAKHLHDSADRRVQGAAATGVQRLAQQAGDQFSHNPAQAAENP